MAKMPTRHAESHLREIGVRRETDRALEQADQLEGRQADAGGNVFEAKIGRIFRPHPLDGLGEQDAVARRRLDPGASAAMALEQGAERLDQQLALAEDVAAVLEGEMHPVERS